MSATVSLSKGVFAFKGAKSKMKKDFSISEFWRQEYGRNDPLVQEITLSNYNRCWDAINGLIQALLDKTYSNVLRDLIDYVKRVGYEKGRNIRSNSSISSKDIPTACLVTGVNMPDHCTLFDNLSKNLFDEVSPYIARLSPRECSNIKMAVNFLVASIVNGKADVIEESDSEDEGDVKSKPIGNKRLKRAQCTLSALSSWYQHCEQIKNDNLSSPFSSPNKKRKYSTKGYQNLTNKKSPKKNAKASRREDDIDNVELSEGIMKPIIVIIENVESIPANVLQDLIHILSEHVDKIPFVFVFGVSTSPSYIHRHLNQEASSFIAMETFQSQPSSLLLSEVIDKVLMNSNISFHLGGKVFKLLFDLFLFHDLSVKNFISGLKFCVLEHFTRGEASFLCCPKKDRLDILENSSCAPKLLNILRTLPSFTKLLEPLSNDEKDRFKSDEYFKEQVNVYLDELEKWYSVFCVLVRILHCLTHDLPGFPLGKQIREVFTLCLSGQVTDTEEFQSAWKIFPLSSLNELLSKTGDALQVLENGDESLPELSEIKNKLSSFVDKASQIESHSHIGPENLNPRSNAVSIDLKPSDRFYLREKLLGVAALKSKTSKSPQEFLKTELLSFFENLFISHLKPFTSKPFYEVFFFDALGNVKYQLLGPVRATISTGLANPQKYLQCECCKLEDVNNLNTSLPDLSICYKLHLECGRLINLCDWLEAFTSLVNGEQEECSKKKNISNKEKKNVNEVLQARFIQSVSELQFLGYVKPTKKKTDHVQRLTWGGC